MTTANNYPCAKCGADRFVTVPGPPPGDCPACEGQLVWQMSEEMRAMEERGPMTVILRPLTAIQIAGLLQLALRHEGVRQSAASVQTAEDFVQAVREYFAEAPAVLEVLTRGDHP